jgi:hypothetical protein
MKSYKTKVKLFLTASFFAGSLLIATTPLRAQDVPQGKPVLEPVGTHAMLGRADGIDIEAVVQSPSNQEAPLQVVCVFEYAEGDIYTSPPALPAAANGLVHVDKQLNGLLTDLRKSGKFKGQRLETLLITPPKGSIKGKQLLIIGLGDRKDFTPDLMTDVGRVAMREALRLGVISYAFASDLKDGGIDSPTGLISSNVVKGALDGYQTDLYLQSKHASAKKPLTKITLLAGQAFYDISGGAIKEYLKTRQN